MSLILLAALIHQIAASVPTQSDLARAHPVQPPSSLKEAELAFFGQWQKAFLESERLRTDTNTARGRGVRDARLSVLHCHPDNRGKFALPAWAAAGMIRSTVGLFALCPSWPIGDSLLFDERLDVDAALEPRFRAEIRQARAHLIASFDSAALARPGDEWIIGQRIRLSIDQGDLDHALLAAHTCDVSLTRCATYAGYVLYRRGDVPAADSAFASAERNMTAAARCAWTDITTLLDSVVRSSYTQLACAGRDSVHQRLWWLADPLWSEPGNERLVEQRARQVEIELHRALDRDERFLWRQNTGSDALAELILRYGWPSYMYWGGVATDEEHATYLHYNLTGTFAHRPLAADLNAPYTTFEYSHGRLQMFPAWRVIDRPFSAVSADWQFSEPLFTPRRLSSAPDVASGLEVARIGAEMSPWWPQQHFAPRTPLVQLPEGQVAFLRRDTSVILATATDLPSLSLGRPNGSPIQGVLVATRSPESIQTVVRAPGTVGSVLALFGPILPRPSLIGIEIPDGRAGGPPNARTRFGVTPPDALNAMPMGVVAPSDLVVLRAPEPDRELPRETEQLLSRMLGSMQVARGSRLGVYWETYGIAAADTTEIAVWIERYSPQGIVRRFGIALDVARDLNTPVAISWKAAGTDPRTFALPGRVPIIGRSVVLDTSKLVPGQYWLDVVVRTTGGEPVRSRRSITVDAN